MTTEQTAIVIREAIRRAAKEEGCKPSRVHNPPLGDYIAVAARNKAVWYAYDQGVHLDALADGFMRTRRTIRDAMRPISH